MNAIVLDQVSKNFFARLSFLERVMTWVGLTHLNRVESEVVKNVSMVVPQGQTVGLVGMNGAGKSTLLKMICGVCRPSEGEVTVKGRVRSILELGVGFDPSMTGWQNIDNALYLMGLSKIEVEDRRERIAEFSELGSDLDKPLKKYSSGMALRLSFSVVTHDRPDVIVIDEVLAVGDTYFQHKSFKRVKDLVSGGSTAIIVSHDKEAIKTLCDRLLVVDEGAIVFDGGVEEAYDFYSSIIMPRKSEGAERSALEAAVNKNVSGSGEVIFNSINLKDKSGAPVDAVKVGDELCLEATVEAIEDVDRLVFGYSIRDRLGRVIYGTNTFHTEQVVRAMKSGEKYIFKVNFLATFGVGSYSIQVAVVDGPTHLEKNYQWIDRALMLNIYNSGNYFEGVCWSNPTIKVVSV